MPCSAEDTAREVLETVPVVMRSIRLEMRRGRGEDLTVPQFRALLYLRRNPGTSLSALADHIGLTLPSSSKMVDLLVERQLVSREESETDRRRVMICLTGQGESRLESALRGARGRLSERLSGLSQAQCERLIEAMQRLHEIFSQDEALNMDAISGER